MIFHKDFLVSLTVGLISFVVDKYFIVCLLFHTRLSELVDAKFATVSGVIEVWSKLSGDRDLQLLVLAAGIAAIDSGVSFLLAVGSRRRLLPAFVPFLAWKCVLGGFFLSKIVECSVSRFGNDLLPSGTEEQESVSFMIFASQLIWHLYPTKLGK